MKTIFGEKIIEEVVEDEAIKKIGLFDIMNDISTTKKYCFDESVFNSFIALKAFSQHIDTIMYANELNKASVSSKQWCHDYLFHSIKPKKRYGKWAKQEKDDDIISLIKKKYSVNSSTAKFYARIFTEDDKKQLIENSYIGGRK